MVYEDLDAGDPTRRDGDTKAFPHPDSEGNALSGVTIPRGQPAAVDSGTLSEVTGDGSDAPAGIVRNYDVYGDTGKEKIGAEATVKVRGECKADLTPYVDGDVTVAVGDALGANGEIFVEEELDADNNLYLVQVR